MPYLTVLFADLAGFTALTDTHGDELAVGVVEHFEAMTRRSLSGSAVLVKTIGDAVMIVAEHVEDAINTGIKIRAQVNAEPNFPSVSIGVHTGTATRRDHDYFGSVVNIAARLAAYARADQIICTQEVAAVARAVATLNVHELGLVRLRNIADPIVLYAITPASDEPAGRAIDPVCRMAVEISDGTARLTFDEHVWHFCSFDCVQRFADNPTNYLDR